ncbi:MAG: 23S rRNA (uracil(1939)-C(5))-methyltransferase RlmD [Pseudomonadota bacterium]|nr:23S rRNA (uracil(1939)-C(5))-methyltransferase RlmD [Pseudomonadota bacterium]
MSKKKRKPLPREPVEAEIESLSDEGRGLTHIDGKAVFVQGALPGERVRFRYTRIQRQFDEGTVVEVLSASPQRVEPRCPHFGVCGGCSLQHMDTAAQIGMKQEILRDVLARIGKVQPQEWLPPLNAEHWGYRRKARLGARFVAKKGRVLVGFRERGASFITDLTRCDILHRTVGERVQAIAGVVDGLSIRTRLPQIEAAMGDGPCVLVFRVLDPPSEADLESLRAFGEAEGFHVYLQEGGPETIRPLPGQAVDLHYSLPRHNVRVYFQPADFTQVNLELNRRMVDRALDFLDPQADERVLDLFCGLGNFALPIARRAAEVTGVEGDEGLVVRARANAVRNGLHNVRFHTADLCGELELAPWLREPFHKALLDPPRSGALQVLDWLPAMGVKRLVYVSCYPPTLARDADRLVNGLGYRLVAAGAMDMFPHTAHVESMAVFEKSEKG